MTLEDLVGIAIIALFFGLLALEALVPARSYPARKLWRVRGVLGLFAIGGLATAIPLALPVEWLQAHRVFDNSQLGLLPGVLLGYGVVSFVSYLWHRATHRFDVLWRGFHQLHHAPARLDMGGATLFHPLDISIYILLSTLACTLLLGLSPAAAAVTGLVGQFYAFFQHLNVNTPVWIGYLIQRPEAHFVHHSRDVHATNYADLPLWDMLFGTFRNPATFGTGDVGFAAPADGRYGAMLAFVDVSETVGTRGPEATRDLTEASSAT